ncbi:MAG: hypothetical protein JO232_22405 [Verrucomicrobia bacterium]|nr:hypothetical protein [Verrucomicrobiota bacterium]
MLKLLDWPFLLCLFLLAFILYFRKQFGILLDRGVTLEWEKFKLKLGKRIAEAKKEIKEEVEQETDPLRDELDAIKGRSSTPPVEAPKAKPMMTNGGSGQGAPTGTTTVTERLKEALADPRYRWRSIERLSHIAGISADEALALFQTDSEVVLGMGKSGNRIARLKLR